MNQLKNLSPVALFGFSVKCAANGVPYREARKIAAFQDSMESARASRVYDWLFVKLATVIMRESNNTHRLSYHVADKIASYKGPHWPEGFSNFAGIVRRSIGRVCLADKQASEESSMYLESEEVKKASAKLLLSLMGRGVAISPDLLKALVGGAAATGAAVGGIGWKLNRDTQQDEDKLEAMKAKIDTYDRITNEIDDEVKNRMTV